MRRFAFRLCRELGVIHPDYLLSNLTSRQFAEWIAEYNIEPFGQDRSDNVVARVGAALWNQKRGKGVEPIDADVFTPKPKPPQTAEEMMWTLRRHLPSGNR